MQSPNPMLLPDASSTLATAPITVMVVDDQTIVRKGLALLLGIQPDLRVVGEADSGESALDQLSVLAPNVVLVDVCLRGGGEIDGFETARRVKERSPNSAVVMLSVEDRAAYRASAQAVGARAFVSKSASCEPLLAALRGAPSAA
jgi:DNA-binding NarL/FixJ family response regulator